MVSKSTVKKKKKLRKNNAFVLSAVNISMNKYK